jgi:hypothetical protein
LTRRHVLFDEAILSFKSLHPYAGALLRQEIILLPPTLLNPEQGVEFIDDVTMTNVPTNPASSPPHVVPQVTPGLLVQAAENSVQNRGHNVENSTSEEDRGTGHEADALT